MLLTTEQRNRTCSLRAISLTKGRTSLDSLALRTPRGSGPAAHFRHLRNHVDRFLQHCTRKGGCSTEPYTHCRKLPYTVTRCSSGR